MTEKRFEWKWSDFHNEPVIVDHSNSDKNLIVLDCEKMLNELNDENEQLKSELISKDDLIQQLKIKLNMDYYNKWKKCNLKYTEICEELLEENKLYKKLSDENEQLKKELESFKPIIFQSDGKPVTLYEKGDVE